MCTSFVQFICSFFESIQLITMYRKAVLIFFLIEIGKSFTSEFDGLVVITKINPSIVPFNAFLLLYKLVLAKSRAI